MRRRTFVAAAVALASSARAARPLRVGAMPGPNAQILEHVAGRVDAVSLALRIVACADERALASDLARGALDAACFDEGVRFADARRADGRALVVVTPTVTLPMALYSRRIVSPGLLRGGDTIALPADAGNLARALVLLQNFGLVALRDDVGLHAGLRDVEGNPRALRLVTRPARALYDALPGVAAVVLPDADAARAGLEPARDSIGLEDARSPWAGVLAVRRDQAREPWVARLVAAYRSQDTRHFVFERWHDSVRRPW